MRNQNAQIYVISRWWRFNFFMSFLFALPFRAKKKSLNCFACCAELKPYIVLVIAIINGMTLTHIDFDVVLSSLIEYQLNHMECLLVTQCVLCCVVMAATAAVAVVIVVACVIVVFIHQYVRYVVSSSVK